MRDHRASGSPARWSAALAVVVLVLLVIPAVSAADAAGPRRAPRPPGRGAAPGSGPSLQRVEALMDSSGWGWRQSGVRVRIGFHPQSCCHQGIFDFPNRTMWIGPTAFRTDGLLRYVVLHELAHGWQSIASHLETVRPDMRPWGRSGLAAFEANADCIAAVWGGGPGHYWDCPPTARAAAARRLANDRG